MVLTFDIKLGSRCVKNKRC